jgi:hypothetical protein
MVRGENGFGGERLCWNMPLLSMAQVVYTSRSECFWKKTVLLESGSNSHNGSGKKWLWWSMGLVENGFGKCFWLRMVLMEDGSGSVWL